MPPRATLLIPVRSLCRAFSTTAPLSTLLAHFTTDPSPLVHEHGLPILAPFLGRSFTGIDGVSRYFSLLGAFLSFEDMRFDPVEEWVVDEVSMAVSLRGTARFTWNGTSQSWNETFIYRVKLAEDVKEGKLKVQEYRVWADTGAAYLARIGKLKDVVEEGE